MSAYATYDRRFWTSRSIALTAILGLHALVLGVGMAMKGPQPDSLPEAAPIRVEFLTAERPRAAVSELEVKLQEPSLSSPIAPDVQISLPEDPPAARPALAPAAPPVAVVAADQGEAEGPVSVSDPDYLQMPRPDYPPAAKRARAQGMVHVRALVDVEGRAREATVVRSSGFELLDRAACEAVRRALFKPYRRNNVARSMVVIVPIEFSIRSRG